MQSLDMEVKLHTSTPALQMGPGLIPSCSTLIQHPTLGLGKAAETDPNALASATFKGDLAEVPGLD